MSLRINHNIASINGHRNMLKNDMAISKSLEKLSSGLKINRAADDAAGLIISEQMRAQIAGLNQAVDNTETAVAMVQTAEGALDEMNTLLNKARELAIHAANDGANDATQLAADQSELDNIVNSITRIANNTQFGTKKILDGTLQASSTYAANVGTPAAFDGGAAGVTVPGAAGKFLAEGTYSLNVITAYNAGTTTDAASTSQAAGVANLFDTQAAVAASTVATAPGEATTNGTGVTASADIATAGGLVAGTTITNASNLRVTVNGVNFDQAIGAGEALSTVISNFNTAHDGSLQLSLDGSGNLTVTGEGATYGDATANGFATSITFYEGAIGSANNVAFAPGAMSGGVDALSALASDGALASTTSLNNGDSYVLEIVNSSGSTIYSSGAVVGTANGSATVASLVSALDTAATGNFNVSLSGGSFTLAVDAASTLYDGVDGNGYYVRMTNTTDGQAGSAAASSGGGVTGQVDAVAQLVNASNEPVVQLTVAAGAADGTIVSNSEYGLTFDLTAAAAGATGSKGTVLTTTTAAEGAVFQIGANRDQTVSISIDSARATDLGRNAANVTDAAATLDSLRTGAYLSGGLAQEAISVIDKAIDDITNLRGELGAVQSNSLESNLSSLRATLENTTAAESVIRDVDFAAESAIFTRNSILIQASTAMLAQANQLPQNVLQLLG